jgi:uncharacterized membrane protein
MTRVLAMGLALAMTAMAACKPAGREQRSAAIPQADAPAAPGEPASAPASAISAEYAVALDLNGTEPFWAMKIRRDALALERPGRAQVLAANPGPRIEGDEAVWQTTATGQGGALRVSLKPGDCSNGMSDKEFPYQATVEYAGERLLGCAEPASAARK